MTSLGGMGGGKGWDGHALDLLQKGRAGKGDPWMKVGWPQEAWGLGGGVGAEANRGGGVFVGGKGWSNYGVGQGKGFEQGPRLGRVQQQEYGVNAGPQLLACQEQRLAGNRSQQQQKTGDLLESLDLAEDETTRRLVRSPAAMAEIVSMLEGHTTPSAVKVAMAAYAREAQTLEAVVKRAAPKGKASSKDGRKKDE